MIAPFKIERGKIGEMVGDVVYNPIRDIFAAGKVYADEGGHFLNKVHQSFIFYVWAFG